MLALALYSLTLFLSAFLLFALQPMYAKVVLPCDNQHRHRNNNRNDRSSNPHACNHSARYPTIPPRQRAIQHEI